MLMDFLIWQDGRVIAKPVKGQIDGGNYLSHCLFLMVIRCWLLAKAYKDRSGSKHPHNDGLKQWLCGRAPWLSVVCSVSGSCNRLCSFSLTICFLSTNRTGLDFS